MFKPHKIPICVRLKLLGYIRK